MKYQQAPLDRHEPMTTMDEDFTDDQHKQELWEAFAEHKDYKEAENEHIIANAGYEERYHPMHDVHHNRGVTGMDGLSRMKEMFVQLEEYIEKDVASHRTESGKIETYKGQPKKWQILDDSVYDKDQIRKIQSAADAPMPEQLDEWKEKHENTFIQLPLTNKNVEKWRDEARFTDTADFDPTLLVEAKAKEQKNFLDRFDKPKHLTE
mmetsp:Transcript_29525/g.44911  ORF Transcript_29525/g.44911 Transcript_29525/m.44911 type:complete len:207 (-) Transcript_29525:38-658(-)